MAAIRVHTPALYRGQPITIIGYGDAALIAVAGYATPHKQALGVITVGSSDSTRRYYVTGHARPVATLGEAARIIAQLREAKGHGGGERAESSRTARPGPRRASRR
jgi:hypothetical protein